MTVAELRTALAAALSTVTGVDVRPYTVKSPRLGDGWVTLVRAVPDGYRTAAATVTAPRSTKTPNTPRLGPAKKRVPRTAITP